ncbi:hypothetical protein ALC53_12645 [Atta colombica]|uniref:Uncharacterized protein n=1 Tax=Atta colombica TaxID=520822 RepID=A0A151HZP4_9HYME|nr:hypothetical protein ALC53_12645 [Atta colombica]
MKTFHVLLLLALIGIVFAKTTLNQKNEKFSKSYDDKESSGILESSGLLTLIKKILSMLEEWIPNAILPTLQKSLNLNNPIEIKPR